MPFEEKAGWEDSNSKFCGVETDFSDDVSSLLYFNTDNGRFDFVLAPLMNPSYRPGLVDESNYDTRVLPFADSHLIVPPFRWRMRVWYEWSVSLPTLSPIHNPNGSSCWMGL
ncbi:unnamed protein product [Arabidopsis arenosa]|uniref:Uncharacterized protein n=1 Tax=Arabidopsis arenosa TaxID=38785 RepID=A0A8S2A5K6_ARAAE|nr:unnamed protein product [Arabidopsis arenosa]